MDDAVVAGNIDGEVAELPEGLLAEDGVVDEILAELAGVGDGLALEGGEGSAGDGAGGDVAGDDAVLAGLGRDGAVVLLVGLDGGVGGGEAREGTGTREVGGGAGGGEAGGEEAEVVVPLEVGLLLAHGNAVGSPDLSGSFQGGESVNNVGIEGGGSPEGGGGGEGRGAGGGEGENSGGELHC